MTRLSPATPWLSCVPLPDLTPSLSDCVNPSGVSALTLGELVDAATEAEGVLIAAAANSASNSSRVLAPGGSTLGPVR